MQAAEGLRWKSLPAVNRSDELLLTIVTLAIVDSKYKALREVRLTSELWRRPAQSGGDS